MDKQSPQTAKRHLVQNFDLSEFTRTGELAAVGAETTEASLDRIRTALADLDKELFSTRASKQQR